MKLRKNTLVWLCVYLILALLTHLSQNQGLKLVFVSVIFYSTFFVKSINPHLLYLAVSLVFYSIQTPLGLLVATLPAYLNSSLLRIKLTWVQFFAVVLLISCSFLSYFGGIEPTLSTMLVYYSCVMVFLEMLNEHIDLDEFYQYVVLMACLVVLILLSELLGGGITIRFGRLALYDNIRRLANTISIPTFISFALLSLRDQTQRKRVLLLTVGIVCSFILFLTLSKGALIATLAGLGVVFLWPKGTARFSFRTVFIPLLLIIVGLIVVNFAEHFGMFHFDRLLEEDEGFSGRMGIWQDYYTLMKKDISHLVFGLGPGDLTRLSVNGYYAHSLFLDIFFSYGIAMSILWVLILIRMALKVLRSNSAISIGLFSFSCLLVATHGNASYMVFYILVAIAYNLSESVPANT